MSADGGHSRGLWLNTVGWVWVRPFLPRLAMARPMQLLLRSDMLAAALGASEKHPWSLNVKAPVGQQEAKPETEYVGKGCQEMLCTQLIEANKPNWVIDTCLLHDLRIGE